MNKYLLALTILWLTLTVGYGQTNVYHPFPDTNAFWGDKGWNIFNSSICDNTRYGINGDTLINGINYKKIYSLSDSTLTNNNSIYFAAIREQNKKVYTVIGSFPEEILYNFNLNVGDTIRYHYSLVWNGAANFSRVVTKIDSILLLNGKYRKRWSFDPADNCALGDTVIEGIGSVINRGLFNPFVNDMLTNGDSWHFECFKHNDTVLYLDNPLCNQCFCSLLTDINKIEERENLGVFPNPFSTQVNIQTCKDFKNATLTVYNSFGQRIKQIENISGKSITLNRDNLPCGLYILRLTQDNKIFTTDKLIITDN